MLDLKSLIRTIPDYPRPGILFRDITTLIEHPQGFKESVERLARVHEGLGISHVAGIEARGFIFGAGVAIEMGVGFVPIRKHGKLPGATIGQNYTLEYGVDTIEIHADVLSGAHKVLLIDDLIATGGTALAAVGLLRRTGAVVENAGFVIDLVDLGGADKLRGLGVRIESLVSFEGH
jgi:adenine phosphoribosyltransferase